MNSPHLQAPMNAEVIHEMRELAGKGATVPQLVRAVQTRLGYTENAVLPILWYFSAAFSLPLPIVLPLREWFTKRNDEEINALLLPEIAKSRINWRQGFDGSANGIRS
jgi:hypothetical protein